MYCEQDGFLCGRFAAELVSLDNTPEFMSSSPKDVYDAIARQLVGGRISDTRMFLSTLQVCVAQARAGESAFEIWCEAPWHVHDSERVVVGSGALQPPTSFGDETEVARADAAQARASNTARALLVGRAIESVTVQPASFGFHVLCADGVVLETFTEDGDAETSWVLREAARAVRGTGLGLELGTRARVV